MIETLDYNCQKKLTYQQMLACHPRVVTLIFFFRSALLADNGFQILRNSYFLFYALVCSVS